MLSGVVGWGHDPLGLTSILNVHGQRMPFMLTLFCQESYEEQSPTPYLCIMTRKEIKTTIVEYLIRHSAERIAIFGSFARGENSKDSDVDVLVSFRELFGLLKLVRIERELSEKLGVKVDLVTERAVRNEKVRQSIAGDLEVIYP